MDSVDLCVVESGAVIVQVKSCAWPEQTEEAAQTVNIDVNLILACGTPLSSSGLRLIYRLTVVSESVRCCARECSESSISGGVRSVESQILVGGRVAEFRSVKESLLGGAVWVSARAQFES